MKENANKLLSETIFRTSLARQPVARAPRVVGTVEVAIATGILLVGCNVNSKSQLAAEVTEGIDINQDPLSAVQKIIEFGKDTSIFEDSSDTPTKVQTVSFRELIEYLPQSPRGWTAEKPKGQTNSFGDNSVSQVKQTYFQQDKTMTISIFDWAFNSALYVPFLLTTEFSQESTEGYNKGIKIGNIPGRENYDYQTQDGSLNLLINRRFFVQIDGKNIEESELREWWNLLDSQSLLRLN